MTGLLCAVALIGMAASWCLGALWFMDNEDKRLSARTIRPANITIEKHIHIKEYTVADSKALDLDFPDSKQV